METKFSIDQKVVYPSQGVGKVIDIFEKKFKDNMLLYYKIYIEASDMVVMIPVEKADELGIRQIVSAKEAEEALNLLSEDFEPITSDWKLRYQMNLDLLQIQVAQVLYELSVQFPFEIFQAQKKSHLPKVFLQNHKACVPELEVPLPYCGYKGSGQFLQYP